MLQLSGSPVKGDDHNLGVIVQLEGDYESVRVEIPRRIIDVSYLHCTTIEGRLRAICARLEKIFELVKIRYERGDYEILRNNGRCIRRIELRLHELPP